MEIIYDFFYKFYNYIMYYIKIEVLYELNMTKFIFKLFLLNKLSFIVKMG